MNSTIPKFLETTFLPKKFESTVLSLIRLRVNFVKLVVPIISNFDRIFASSYYYYFDR